MRTNIDRVFMLILSREPSAQKRAPFRDGLAPGGHFPRSVVLNSNEFLYVE